MTAPSQWLIALVDDDIDSLKLMQEILTLRGAQVVYAAVGEQFLKLMDELTPTAIVMDLAMPNPDGWELLRQIRATPRLAAIPVIAVTSFYSDTIAREALEAGFDAFLAKPLKASALIGQLEALIW